MTAAQYRAARIKRGTQRAVAVKLGIYHSTIHYRECGKSPVSKEAELALFSLPLKKVLPKAK